MPIKQNDEQHSEAVVHAFPSVEHVVLRGVQVPPVPQVPLQHCELVVHDLLSLVHGGGWHEPATQLFEQQSPDDVHATPSGVQTPPSGEQFHVHALSPPNGESLPLSFTVPSVAPSGDPPLSPPHDAMLTSATHDPISKRAINRFMR
jgi:hypothetical protein